MEENNNVNQTNENGNLNQGANNQTVNNQGTQNQQGAQAQNPINNQAMPNNQAYGYQGMPNYQGYPYGYANMNNGQQQYQPNSQEPQIPEKYRPISAWGYFGYSLLFMIPLVGLILEIVFACDNSNINRRNFARAQFCWLIIAVIILVLIFAVGCGTYNSVRSSLYF